MRSETKSKKEEGRSTLELCQNFQTSRIMNPNKEAREVEETEEEEEECGELLELSWV